MTTHLLARDEGRGAPLPPRTARARAAAMVSAMSAAGLAVAGLALSMPSAHAAMVTGQFTQWGPDGGGATNVLASNGKGVLIAGTDTSGLFRSTNGGASWRPVNLHTAVNFGRHSSGVDVYSSTTERLKVASVTYVPNPGGSTTGRWYAGVGNGKAGAVLYSTDDGLSWASMATPAPVFNGGGVARVGLPARQPRSVGNLLAADSAGTYLYAGSYDGGVWRCRLDGNTVNATVCLGGTQGWTNIGLAPRDGDAVIHHVRSIALNTSAATPRLYVSTIDVDTAQGDNAVGVTKVYLVDNPASATSTSWKAVTTPPAGIEELRYVKSTNSTKQFLYSVGTSGIHRISTETSGVVPSFVPVQTGGVTGDANTALGWTGVDGAATATGSRIVVTTGVPFGAQTKRRTAVLDVTDSGTSFTASALTGIDNDSSTGKAKLNATMLGGGTWDLQTSRADNTLGQIQYLGSYVLVENAANTTTPSKLWIAGKMAMYRTDWTTGTFGNWSASAKGLTNTYTYGIAQDPRSTSEGTIVWPDADLIVEKTNTTLTGAKRCSPPETGASGTDKLISGTAAYSLKYQSDGTLWLATADQDGWSYGSGQLWRGTVTSTTCSWTLEKNLATAVGGNKKISAFDVTGQGPSTVITALIAGKGIVRGTGDPFSTAGLTWTSYGSAGTLPNFPAVDPSKSSGTSVSEETKGVSLITVGDKIVVARPAADSLGRQGGAPVTSPAAGVHVCAVDAASTATPRVLCKPVAGLWSEAFNYLQADPTTPNRVLWSASPSAVLASAPQGDPNAVTTGKAGVWSFDVSTYSPNVTSIAATQLVNFIGGPMTVVKDPATNLTSLVVVMGHAALPKITIQRTYLGVSNAGWDIVQASGSQLNDAGVDATGVLVTKRGPAAGVWRIYVSTLGGGVLSADVTSAW